MREITVSLIGPEKVPKRGDPDRRVWRARYVDRQGRRRAQTIGDAREVSRVKAEKLVRSMERGFAADSTKVERLKRVTVAELVERYIAEKREGWTAKTLKANQEAAAHLLAAVSPRKLVRDFSVANAKAVVEHMMLSSYRNGVPLLGLSSRHAKMGALLTLSFASSEDIGRQAGELANRALSRRSASGIPFTMARQVDLTVSLKTAEKLGIEVPGKVLSRAQVVIR